MRKLPRVLRIAGRTLAILGALALLIGAALPWLRFTVFGSDISIPGITGWGALTGAIGLAALSGIWFPRAAIVWVLLGMVAATVGAQAKQEGGRVIRREVLRVQRLLMPINERLAQVTLPPVEPFSSVLPTNQYIGPGPAVTIAGGVALGLGAAMLFAGDRLRRTCTRCGVLWNAERASALRFCYRCGTSAAGAAPACSRCYFPLVPGDKFCERCGQVAAVVPASSP